ncbi:jg17854, partial [Pararge aegeria aegeria]
DPFKRSGLQRSPPFSKNYAQETYKANSEHNRETKEQPAKKLTQQIFHPSLFHKHLKRDHTSTGEIRKERNIAQNANPIIHKPMLSSPIPASTANLTRQRSSSLGDTAGIIQQEVDRNFIISPGTASASQTDTPNDVNDPINPPSWQKMPSSRGPKRKRVNTPPISPNVETNNSFSDLPLDPPDDSGATTGIHKQLNRPPPIILYGVEDVNELFKLLESTSNSEHFKLKIVNKNNLRIVIDNVEEYKKIIDVIRQKGLIGHTFTRKDTKCCRIVIKNLHHSTPLSAITEAVESTGNRVRGEIINARYGPDKNPTSTFFVNVEPSANNKLLKDIEYVFHQKVKIETPRKSTTVVQCHRCQQYGHSKNNCMRPYRCVKCGEGHKTSECPKKDRNSPAKCALCLLDHPANYKGCQVYKEILSRKKGAFFRKPFPVISSEG